MHELPEKRGIYENHITNHNKTCLAHCFTYMFRLILANDNLSSVWKTNLVFQSLLVQHEKTGSKADWYGELDNFLLFLWHLP